MTVDNKPLDLESVKAAVRALFQTSATFSCGVRDLKKTTNLDYGYNYEHFNRVEDFAKEIYNKIEDLEMELDSMIEESDEFEAAERKHKACIVTNVCTCERNVSFNTCRICLCDMSEHNWEIHNAEARAETL